jgi:hypothetical protein
MHTDDPVLDLTDRFTAALNSHGLDAVLALGGMLATTPKARFSVEEQLSDGSARAVVRWRCPWETGTSAVSRPEMASLPKPGRHPARDRTTVCVRQS